jgi:trk system potassium uptake protein TrkH
MVNFRPILLVIGILLVVLAAAMALCAVVDLWYGSPDWHAFISSAFYCVFVGGGLIFSNHDHTANFSIKQAFILTVFSWSSLAAFATLPFMLSSYKISFTDAYFEVMSGLTTTGSTVLVGLDTMPPGLLLWRGVLQALGGVGIIVMAMAILPMLKIGGMQLFRTESSDKSEKILPRATQLSASISMVYISLVTSCTVLLWLAGMSMFDAVNHSVAAVSTGGFSTHDASVAYYNNVHIEVILDIFMLLGGMPFVLFVQMAYGNYRPLLLDSQIRWYLSTLLIGIVVLTCWEYLVDKMPFPEALRHSSFNLISIATTTGFASADYSVWSPFAVVLFFFFTIGVACTGSTAGGIKVFRFQVLYETARAQVYQLAQPHGVFRAMFNGKPITETVTNSVLGFFILYALCFSVVALLLSLTGLDFITSMSASATALSNTGPGLGKLIGPAGNFSTLTDNAKWVLSAAMLLGRLELFTVLVLFSPHFWKN